MKVIAYGASSSRNSINKRLAAYAAGLIEGAEVELLDLNDYEMPLFSEDREKQLGQPEQAKAFFNKIGQADLLVISFAEHNGSYTAAYKNLFDWTSRINQKVYQNKPLILLSTSPGPGGAASVLAAAKGSAPYFAGEVKGALSLPSFYDNFDMESGAVTAPAFNDELLTVLNSL